MKYLFFILVFTFAMESFAQRNCIRAFGNMSFRDATSSSLVLEMTRGDYEIQVFSCFELPWARRIAFDTFSPNWICEFDDLLVIDNFRDRVIERCQIKEIIDITK